MFNGRFLLLENLWRSVVKSIFTPGWAPSLYKRVSLKGCQSDLETAAAAASISSSLRNPIPNRTTTFFKQLFSSLQVILRLKFRSCLAPFGKSLFVPNENIITCGKAYSSCAKNKTVPSSTWVARCVILISNPKKVCVCV